MKFTYLALLGGAVALGLAFTTARPMQPAPTETAAPAGSVYDFTVKSIDGKDVKLSQYQGKKLLIVNTASQCGFTPQYKELEALAKQQAGKVVVLGFPSNSFNQELSTDAEVAAFCQKNFGVTFPLFRTAPVKGDEAQPLFKFLAAQAKEAPNWNFCKYLVDEKGQVVKFYPSRVKPSDPELMAALTK